MKDLKSILESLFDNDLVTSDVEFGELYRLSDVSHDNMVSNRLDRIVYKPFKIDKLKRLAAKTKNKVDLKNGFVEYFSKDCLILPDFINVILGVPAQDIISDEKPKANHVSCDDSAFNVEKLLKSLKDSWLYDVSVKIIRYGDVEDGYYTIEIWSDVYSSRPNRLKLTFVKI